MNKAELTEQTQAIAAEILGSAPTKKEVDAIITAMTEAIMSAVADGDKVTLVGFGVWEQRQRSAREGRNPKTGETMTIPAAAVVRFAPGTRFKATVGDAAPVRELATV